MLDYGDLVELTNKFWESTRHMPLDDVYFLFGIEQDDVGKLWEHMQIKLKEAYGCPKMGLEGEIGFKIGLLHGLAFAKELIDNQAESNAS